MFYRLIRKLKEIHTATQPAHLKQSRKAKLQNTTLDELKEDAARERGDGASRLGGTCPKGEEDRVPSGRGDEQLDDAEDEEGLKSA